MNYLIPSQPLVDYARSISSGANYGAPITELIIYPSDQSATRTAIEGNINTHYEIYA